MGVIAGQRHNGITAFAVDDIGDSDPVGFFFAQTFKSPYRGDNPLMIKTVSPNIADIINANRPGNWACQISQCLCCAPDRQTAA